MVMGRGFGISTRQVKPVLSSGVPLAWAGVGGAGIVMTLRGRVLSLREGLRGFNDSSHQATLDMPFNVTVEKPDS